MRILGSIVAAGLLSAVLITGSAARAQSAQSAAFKPFSMPVQYAYTVDPSLMPSAGASGPRWHRIASDGDFHAHQSALRQAANPFGPLAWDLTPDISTVKKFAGMAGNSSTCLGTCFGAGTDVAASKNWVLESVGVSLAVYSPAGVLQSGWPKDYLTFFGIPLPGPCDPMGPAVSFGTVNYDANDHRFFAFVAVDEGQFFGDTCPDSDQLYAAVSTTSDPRGAWKVFVMTAAPGDVVALYPNASITPQAVCASVNTRNQPAPYHFAFAAFGCANKKTFESGGGALNGFMTSAYDSVVPATVYGTTSNDPGAALFVASQGRLSRGCLTGPCNQYLLSDLANPGSGSPTLSTLTFTSPMSYNPPPPSVDQPGCTGCVTILDQRVSPHPVFNNGGLFFAHNTGVVNGTFSVAGALWAQLGITLDSTTHGLVSALFAQGGIIKFTGDKTAVSPGVTVDGINDMVLTFDSVGSTLDPSMQAASRIVSYPAGKLSKLSMIVKGTMPTSTGDVDDRGGATIDDLGRFWIAHSWSNGVWGTELAKVKP